MMVKNRENENEGVDIKGVVSFSIHTSGMVEGRQIPKGFLVAALMAGDPVIIYEEGDEKTTISFDHHNKLVCIDPHYSKPYSAAVVSVPMGEFQNALFRQLL